MIIVTGANGQLGGDVCMELKKNGIEHIGIDADTVDITEKKQVDAFFDANRADTVIHCAAYTAVDRAEDDDEKCVAVNYGGTKNIADCCRKYNIKLIYVSTDYVFDGTGDAPFEADSRKGPLNVYGKSKLMGENAVTDALTRYFIVRTSWVFGEKNTNFIHTMLNLGQTRSEVKAVDDQIGSPTYSKHLASLLCQMAQSEKYGTYHATNEGFCSWYELTKEIFLLKGITTNVVPVSSDEFASKAVRPHNSRLSKRSLDLAGFERLPKWREAVREYVKTL